MAKLRFDSLTLSQFNVFKPTPKKRTNSNSNKRLTSKLIRGVCFKDGDIFKIQIDAKTLKPDIIEKGQPDILILDFTEESYDLKDVISVFDRNPDKNGRYTRYVRNITNAKFMPSDPDRYVPFCCNWICSGYIVRRNGKMMFDFNECIAPEGYSTFIPEKDE